MNSAEQQAHTTRTNALEREMTKIAEGTAYRLDVLTRGHDAFARDVRDLANRQDAIAKVMESNDQTIRKHVELGERALEDMMAPMRLLMRRGIWGRLNWLLTGR